MSYSLTPAEQKLLDTLERINAKVIAKGRAPAHPVQRGMASGAPAVGDQLTVKLPGEILRCVVDSVIDDDRLIVEIASTPMARTHNYRLGDKTGVRRRMEYGTYFWEALDDRDFIANRSPTEYLSPVMKPVITEEKVAPKRKVAAKKKVKR